MVMWGIKNLEIPSCKFWQIDYLLLREALYEVLSNIHVGIEMIMKSYEKVTRTSCMGFAVLCFLVRFHKWIHKFRETLHEISWSASRVLWSALRNEKNQFVKIWKYLKRSFTSKFHVDFEIEDSQTSKFEIIVFQILLKFNICLSKRRA